MNLTTMLVVAFVVLKLCGVIAWSWLWVFAPILFSIVLSLLIVAVAGAASR